METSKLSHIFNNLKIRTRIFYDLKCNTALLKIIYLTFFNATSSIPWLQKEIDSLHNSFDLFRFPFRLTSSCQSPNHSVGTNVDSVTFSFGLLERPDRFRFEYSRRPGRDHTRRLNHSWEFPPRLHPGTHETAG